jgi:hypothetical protein
MDLFDTVLQVHGPIVYLTLFNETPKIIFSLQNLSYLTTKRRGTRRPPWDTVVVGPTVVAHSGWPYCRGPQRLETAVARPRRWQAAACSRCGLRRLHEANRRGPRRSFFCKYLEEKTLAMACTMLVQP